MHQESIFFFERYKTDYDCLLFLAEIKWNSKFRCVRCGHTAYTVRKTNLARDCNRCHHLESPTSGTIFHRLRFGLRKAFFIAFTVLNRPAGFSILQLSEELEISYPTAWMFVRKIKKSRSEYEAARKPSPRMYFFTGQFTADRKKHNRREGAMFIAHVTKGGSETVYLQNREQKTQLAILSLVQPKSPS